MSVTVTKTEGVTVFTVTSNGRSNCPLLCQILGSLCYSPVCSVSKSLKNLGGTQRALGTIQIMIGLLNIGLGAVIFSSQIFVYTFLSDVGAPFWLGIMFVLFGVMCILADRFPSPCLVGCTGMMNFFSAAFAVTAIVVYTIDIFTGWWYFDYSCEHSYDYMSPTSPPETKDNGAICKRNGEALQVLGIGMDIIMIIFSTVQLCVAISACVLAFKAACKKETAQQDPELHEPLVDGTLFNPTV